MVMVGICADFIKCYRIALNIRADRHLYGHLKQSLIYIHKSIVSFFIFLPENEGVLNVDGVSGWRNRKDDPADICLKAALELLI